MNRHPVTTRTLRRIQDQTGWPYVAAFERKDSDLWVCALENATLHWVRQDTYECWDVNGLPLPPAPNKSSRAILQ